MAIEGAIRGLTGAYNWTNPGAISHNEVLELYRDYLPPGVHVGELHGGGAGGR